MPIEIKTMEEAARLYRKVEASLEEKAAEYEKKTEKEKLALKSLEVIMRAMLNQAGVQSMNVPGVAEVKIVPKTSYSSSDWDMTYTWLIDNDVPEVLQKRIHDGNMSHWIETHPEAGLPPGISVFVEHTLKVLKGK
jgi:hypothetical protein